MPLVVPELIWFAVLLFSFGVVYTLRKFIEAMIGTLVSDLEKIPVIGSKIAGVVESVEQAVANALGSAEGAIDQAIGASFHALGRLTDWLWREFKSHSLIGALLAQLVAALVQAFHALKHEVHHITKGVDHAIKRLQAQEKRLELGIDRVTHKVKEIEQGIGDDVLPRLKSLDKEVTRLADRVIPNIRGIAQGAENDVAALREWVTDNVPLVGTAAFAGAVAWALGRLGLGGLRCDSNPFKNNKNACGLWGDLSQLLGVLATVIAVEDFEQLVRAMQEAEQGVATGLHDLLDL